MFSIASRLIQQLLVQSFRVFGALSWIVFVTAGPDKHPFQEGLNGVKRVA